MNKFLILGLILLSKTLTVNDFSKMDNLLKTTKIKTTLVVKIEKGLPIASLTFQNISKEKQYIDNFMGFLGGEIKNNLFTIRNSQNKEVSYIGIMVKMAAPTREDYHVLLPKKSITTTLNLAKVYDLKPNYQTYTIQYSGYHGSPDDENILQELISNTAMFSY
jgi:hypothetical protein